MTKKEQILEYFKDINVAYNNSTMHDTLEHMLEDLEEVRHGYWKYPNGSLWGIGNCSVCGALSVESDTANYCPNCGAKMDGDSNTHNTDSTR